MPSGRLHSVLLFTALFVAPQLPGQAPTVLNANAQDLADKLVKLHQNWGATASTPNATLLIKESGRSGQTIRFRLIAQGIPKNATYSLVSWPVTQKTPATTLQGVTLDASGMAVCAGTPGACGRADKPNDPIDLVTRPVPGEPLRLALVATAGAIQVFGKIVPVPMRGEDRGCTLEATLLSPRGELILIEGSGFPPNSEAIMTSNSQREGKSTQEKIDANGKHVSAAMPFVKDETHGTLTMNLKSAQCSPSVSIPWGSN